MTTRRLYLKIAIAITLIFLAACDTSKNFNLIIAKLETQLAQEANQTKIEFLKKYSNDTKFQQDLDKKIEGAGYTDKSHQFRSTLLNSITSMFKIHDVNRVTTNTKSAVTTGAAFSAPAVSCSQTYANMERSKKIGENGLMWMVTNPDYDARQAFCDFTHGGWEKIAVLPKAYTITKETFGDDLYPNNLLMNSEMTKKDKLAYREANALVPKTNPNLFVVKFLDHLTGKAVYMTPNPFDSTCTLPKFFDGTCAKNPLIVKTSGDMHAREIKTAWALDRTYDMKQGLNAFIANGADVYLLL